MSRPSPRRSQIVARRASGSLRDAQSLLDRLLASGSPLLTVEVVNGLLGTASDERLLAMIEALANHDAAAALRLLEQSAERRRPARGIPLRDHRFHARCPGAGRRRRVDAPVGLAAAAAAGRSDIVERWTIDSILAALQILSECRSRMRGSLHGRLLVELALVRIARLEDLTDLARSSSGWPRSKGGRARDEKPDHLIKNETPGLVEPAPMAIALAGATPVKMPVDFAS